MATPLKKSSSKSTKRSPKKARASKKSAARPTWQTRYEGVTFCFTGKLLPGHTSRYPELIEAHGGKIVTSISAQVDYLVVGYTTGTSPSTAEKKALQLNQKSGASIQILEASNFFSMFIPDREQAITMLKAGPEGIEAWNQIVEHGLRGNSKVDLSGTNFRGCDLSNAILNDAVVDDCDFRKANLDGAIFQQVSRARYDGATGDFAVASATDCSFKACSLTDQAGCIRFENCNLSQCKLSGHNPGYHHSFRRTEATACCFDKADLHGLDLNAAKFAGSSFCKANLKECTLRNADLTNCDLTGANLVFTELCHVNLTSANLTRTDLRDANLVDAVLSGATIDGANFKNAQVAGVDLSTLDTAKAKGLDEAAANVQIGQAGAKVQELEQAAQVASHLTSSIVITTQKEELTAIVGTYGSGSLVFYWVRAHQDLPRLHSNARTLEQAMTDIARHFSRGELQVDSVTAKGIKAPLKGKQLKMLCLAAWCEVFGREMPTDEELKEASAAKREGEQEIKQEMLDELRGGTKGVQRWNARSRQERQQAGHFNKVDLKGAKLANIDLKGMEFQQADFTGAKLKKADLGTADLKKAIFAHVDATGASFTGAKLNDADFQKATLMKCSFARANLLRTMFGGANLTGAKFGYANLSGADFTDAKLADVNFESTRFDEKTSFPEGFGLPEGLIWSGQGNDPRVAEKIKQVKSAGPVDFDAFMEQLEANFDASRLKKAMSMLKADSFQLFADVQSDSITGVVKSQTDADLVYSCRLDAEGTFACCTQNLNPCGGLRGALCKHLLVLIVGLTKGEELDPTTVNSWVAASKLQGPKLDKDLMSEVFLRYKGAEAGEIDWRPTETVPEDYYAF